MSLLVSQMRRPPTRDEILDVLLGFLSGLGFQTTSWHDSSIQRLLLLGVSSVGADFAGLVTQVVNAGFNDYAVGAAHRAFSKSAYDNTAQRAVRTAGPCTLTSTATIAHVFGVGQLVAATDNGVEFRNTTGGTVPAGGSLAGVQFEATLAGAAGNVANNAIRRLLTPLAGVTISNPAGTNGLWYTTSGADPESAAKLRLRNSTRWGTLNQIAMPTAGYVHLALTIPAVTRVRVDDTNPRGPNTIDVYIATASGPAAPTEINALQALYEIKKPPGVDVLVMAPASKIVNVSGPVHIQAARNTATKRAEIEAALLAFLNSVPIGGILLPPSTTPVMPFSELVTAVSRLEAVTAFAPTSPAANVNLAPNEIVVPGAIDLDPISA